MNKENLELARWTAEFAKKNGADDVAVGLGFSRGIEIGYRDNKIENLQESTSKAISLSVYVNNKYSNHSTNDLRKTAMESFIKEAIASTKYLTADKFRSLPDPKFYPKNLDRALNLLDESFNKVTTEQRVDIVKELADAAKGVSDKIISTTASYGDSYSESILIHSNGFEGTKSGTSYSFSSEVTVDDGKGGRPEDYSYAVTRFFNKLPKPSEIGIEAAKRALNKIGQAKIESGKYTMLVENRSTARLISMLSNPLSARALQQKSSWLDGMMNKQIASEKLTIIDDPFVSGGLASRLYDGEGIAAKKRVIVEKGILKEYYVDNYYGKKIGMEPNSGSSSNIFIDFGTRNLDEIVKNTEKAILVTQFIGGNSNPTTGDFSFGVMGFLIENGKISKPINEMNISGTAKDLLSGLLEIGNDPSLYSSWQVPTLVFENVNFSGL